MATNLGKPFGVKIITSETIEEDLWTLPIEDYFGIGNSTANKLKKIGIITIGQLANERTTNQELYTIFKKHTKNYINEARGLGNNELKIEHNDQKVIGNEITFPKFDLNTRNEIYQILKLLANKVSTRSINRNVLCQTLNLVIRNNKGK
ncbi:UNVERIFIED_CONTAM: hypothetical protein O8I53_13150 [Campylobacter lari]